MPSCLLPSDLRTSNGSWGDGTFCCYKGAVDDVRSEEYVMVVTSLNVQLTPWVANWVHRRPSVVTCVGGRGVPQVSGLQ